MHIGPKYKIARRVGAPIFEKTQTQKYSLRAERKAKTAKFGKPKSEYGAQLNEKQKARFTYGLSERQLSNYAHTAFAEKDPTQALHKALEMRADSAVYRAGFSSTRRAARQAVSHGHFTINGRRITTPSHAVRKGDVIAIRDGSKASSLFTQLAEQNRENGRPIPQWLSVDIDLLKAEVKGEPLYNTIETGLDYATVFEFYSR